MLKLVDKQDERGRDDDALMLLCAGNDTGAFAELMRRHESNLRRFLGRMVGQAEARDLCQETFIELWQRRRRYHAQGRFSVLLYRVARHKAYNHLRWRKVRTLFATRSQQADSGGPISAEGNGLDELLQQERETMLNQVLAGLPPKMREAVVLHHAEGIDYRSMAEITGVPEGTLRARTHRGLALLRERLERREE